MRGVWKWLGRVLLVLALGLGATAFVMRAELARLWAVNTLFEPDKIVHNFSHMSQAFRTTPVARGPLPMSELPYGPEVTLPPTLPQWIEARAVTAMLVLKNGAIVYEAYFQGTDPKDLRISWSISKSFVSALFGVLLDNGTIGSLDDRVTDYVPQLAGTAYDQARIIDVMQMSSGVVFNEDYFDPRSDINRMGRVLALGRQMDDFTANLTETFAPPGETWTYVSIDTHVLAMVARAASGESLADLMSEHIVSPLGFEQSPYYLVDGEDVAFALGGLSLTTRDLGRFGLMIGQNGTYDGRQVVPAEWIARATRASANTPADGPGYGYQWWVPKGAGTGEFMARGVYGQYLYIDQSHDLVIVVNAADRGFRNPGIHDGNVAMFREIATALEGER